MRAELQGFKTVEQRGVTVSLGQTTTVNLQLEVGGLTEVVQVTGTTAVVDTTSTTTGAVLSAELLQRVPVGRRFTDALYLAPGVSNSGAAGTANPSMSGSTGLDNLYVVDGVNITNTGYGAVGSYSIVFGSLGTGTPFDFVQEVQVKTGGYEAEFGQSMGGVVNVVTKSGTNDLRGSVFGYFQPAELEAGYKTYESPNGTVNTVGQGRTDTGIEGGFPIIRNKLFFFGAINPAWEKRTFTAPEGFPLRSLGEVDRDRMLTSYSAKGTYQLNSSHRFDASFFGDPAKGDMGPQRDHGADGHRHLVVQRDRVRRPQPDRPLRRRPQPDLAARRQLLPRLQPHRARRRASTTWRVTDTTVVPNSHHRRHRRATSRATRAPTCNTPSRRRHGRRSPDQGRLPLRGRGVLAGQPAHGADVHGAGRPADRDGRVGQHRGRPDVRPDLACDPRELQHRNASRPRTTGRFFVQDTWRVGERLTINPGLRYEQQTLVGTIQELTTLQGQHHRQILAVKATGRRASARCTTCSATARAASTATTAASSRASRTTSPPARSRPTRASPVATISTPT